MIEKRGFQRKAQNYPVSFCCCITEYYPGTLTNISEKGMFISTSISFPLESRLTILINTDSGMLNIPAKVRWLRKSTDMYNGIGVEVSELTNKYFEFVSRTERPEATF